MVPASGAGLAGGSAGAAVFVAIANAVVVSALSGAQTARHRSCRIDEWREALLCKPTGL